VACLSAGGTADPTFNSGNAATALGGGWATSGALGPDGQIVVVGNNCNGSVALAQFTPGGVLDTSFNGSGTLTTDISGQVTGVGVQTSGQIVVGGTFNDGCFDLARFNSDGSLDDTFGPNGNGQVSTSFASAGVSSAYADSIAIGPGDTIVAGGEAYDPQSGAFDAALAQYTSGGDLDTTFGTAGSGTALADIGSYAAQVAIEPGGDIVAAGPSSSGPLLAGFLPGQVGQVVSVKQPSLCVWDGGGADNLWTDSAEWSGGVAPIPGDQLQFAGTTQLATDNDFPAGTEFQSVEIAASGVQISGNSFAVADGLTVDSPVDGTTFISAAISGGGSLTQAGSGTLILAGDNTYGGVTTISAGRLDVGTGVSGSAAGTLGAGSVTDDGMLAFNRDNDLTVANVISGTGDVLDEGSGTLTLSAADDFQGLSLLDDGTLRIGNAAAIPSGAGYGGVSLNGTLDLNGFSIALNALSGSGTVTDSAAGSCTLTVGVDGESSEFDGLIEDGSGNVALTKLGAGTFTLGGDNTYSGLTTIGAGRLQVGYGASGSAAGTLGAGSVTDDGTLAFNRDNDLTVSNVISGTGDVLDEGSGTLTLSAANDFHGFSQLYYGTVRIGNVDAIPSGTGYGDVGLNGTLDLNGYSISLNGIGGSGTITNSAAESCTLTVGVNGESSTFGGVIEDGSGGVALTKVGAGTFTLIGDSTYSGLTTISAGTLELGSGSGSAAGTLGSGSVTDDGMLAFNRDNDLTVANVISGTGGVLDEGTGTLTLSGANDFHSFTQLYCGTVRIGNAAAIPSGTGYGDVTLIGVLDLNGYSITINGLQGSGTVTNSAAESCTLTVGAGDQSDQFAGVIEDGSGSVALTKIGAGLFTLTGDNTYSGVTTIGGGTLSFADGSLGTGGIAFAGGTLRWASGNTQDVSSRFLAIGSGQTAIVDTNGNDVTLAGTISGGGGLTVVDAGALTLSPPASNPNTYGGGTTVSGGATLQVGSTGAIPGGAGCAGVTLDGFLDLGGYSVWVNGINGTGTVTNSAAESSTLTVGADGESSVFCGLILDGSGSIALTKLGAGTFTLTRDNAYSGGTTVSGGILEASPLSTLPLTGGVSVENGATLAVSSSSDLAALLDDTANVTYEPGSYLGVDTTGGDISSSADIGSSYPNAGLEKLGPGTLTLTGANSYSGGTAVSAGILEASPLSSLPLTGGVSVEGGATLAVSSASDLASLLRDTADVTYEPGSLLGVDTTRGDISSSADIGSAYPSAGVDKLGPGTLNLNSAQTYSGSTTVSGGVLALAPTWTVIPGRGMEGTDVVEFNDTGEDQNSAQFQGFFSSGGPIALSATVTSDTAGLVPELYLQSPAGQQLAVDDGATEAGNAVSCAMLLAQTPVTSPWYAVVGWSPTVAHQSGQITVDMRWMASSASTTDLGSHTATVGLPYSLTVPAPQSQDQSYTIYWGDGQTTRGIASAGTVYHTFTATGTPTVVEVLVGSDGVPVGMASGSVTVTAAAQKLFWNGGGNSTYWSDATNWLNSNNQHAAPQAGDALVFQADTTNNNDFGAGTWFQSVEVASTANGITLAGNSLSTGSITVDSGAAASITANVVIDGSLDVVAADATASLSLDGGLSGSGSLTKTDPGTLTLGSASNYVGDTTITGGAIVAGVDDALPMGTTVILGDEAGDSGVLQLGSGGGGTVGQALAGLVAVGNTAYDQVINGGASSTLVLTPGGSDTFAGVLGGTESGDDSLALQMDGTGTLWLSGQNTYSGNTNVENGTVVLAPGPGYFGPGQALPIGTSVTLGDATTGTSGVLQLDSDQEIAYLSAVGNVAGDAVVGGATTTSTLTIVNYTTDTYAGTLGGGGTDENNLALEVEGLGSTPLTLTGNNNTYTGDTIIDSGSRLEIGNAGALGPGTVTGPLSGGGGGGYLRFDPTVEMTVPNAIAVGGAAVNIEQYGTATTVLTGNVAAGNISIYGGTLQFGDGSTNGSLSGIIRDEDGSTSDGHGVVFDNATDLVYNGAITEDTGKDLQVTKEGTGELTLSPNVPYNVNTYTGGTTVDAGVLDLASPLSNALPSAGTVSVLGGATLAIAGNDLGTFLDSSTYTENVSFATGSFLGVDTNASGNVSLHSNINVNSKYANAGLYKLGTGTLTINAPNTYGGNTIVGAGGTLQIGAGGTLPTGTGMTVNGTLDLDGNSASVDNLSGSNAGIITSSGSSTLTVDESGAPSEFDGTIQGGALALSETGTGTLILGGASTYSGNTAIDGGTIVINGSIASPVFVESGGGLSGTGTINGPVTVNGGTLLAPASGSALTVDGNLSFPTTAQSTYSVALPSSGSSPLVVTGSVTLGNVALSVSGAISDSSGVALLIQGASSLTGTLGGLVEGAALPVNSYGTSYANYWITYTYDEAAALGLAFGAANDVALVNNAIFDSAHNTQYNTAEYRDNFGQGWVRANPFTIGGFYYDTTVSPEEAAACGLNASTANSPTQEDDTGITASNSPGVAWVEGLFPYDTNNSGMYTLAGGLYGSVPSFAQQQINSYGGNPAAWYVCEEPTETWPNGNQFPGAAEVASWVKSAYPSSLVTGVMNDMQGTESVDSGTLQDYINAVQPDVLESDLYPCFSVEAGNPPALEPEPICMGSVFYCGMTVRDVALNNKLPYMMLVGTLSDSSDDLRLPSDSELRAQDFAYLTMGYTGLTDYFWTHNGAEGSLDADPQLLADAAQIDAEVSTVGDTLRFATSTAVGYIPGPGNGAEPGNPTGFQSQYATGLVQDPDLLPDWSSGMTGGDSRITGISVVNNGPQNNAVIGFFNDDLAGPSHDPADHSLFMITNLNQGPNLTPAQAAEQVQVTFAPSVASLLWLNPDTGQQQIIQLTPQFDGSTLVSNLLTVTLPGGTGYLYKFGSNVPFYQGGAGTAAPPPPTLIWAGGSNGNWMATNAWVDASGNHYSWGSNDCNGDSVVFPDSGDTVTVDGTDVDVGNITFESGGCAINAINGNTITLGSNSVVDVAPTFTDTIHCPLVGPGSLAVTSSTCSGSDPQLSSSPGTLILTGANTYAGMTVIRGGTLEYDGTLSAAASVSAAVAGEVWANAGATLSGEGTVSRPVTVLDAGTLMPITASPTDTLTVGDPNAGGTGLLMSVGSTLSIGVNGDTPGAYDYLIVQGSLDLVLDSTGDSGSTLSTYGTYSPPIGSSLAIIQYSSGDNPTGIGAFINGSVLVGPQQALMDINYSTAGDVLLGD
jgi:uncharacterized delta-60 repeat protein